MHVGREERIGAVAPNPFVRQSPILMQNQPESLFSGFSSLTIRLHRGGPGKLIHPGAWPAGLLARASPYRAGETGALHTGSPSPGSSHQEVGAPGSSSPGPVSLAPLPAPCR